MQSGLLKLGLTNKDKILEQMDYLLSKSRNALEQQHEAALAKWKRIEQTLLPEGKPQERVYNILEYMNRYGLNLVDRLMEIPYGLRAFTGSFTYNDQEFKHQIIGGR